MSTATLRLYFELGQQAPAQGFWRRLFAPSLGDFLMKKAKAEDIEQVVWQNIFAGYMRKGRPSYDISDIPPLKMPQCLELVDEEPHLRRFLQKYRDVLKNVHAVLTKAYEAPLAVMDTHD